MEHPRELFQVYDQREGEDVEKASLANYGKKSIPLKPSSESPARRTPSKGGLKIGLYQLLPIEKTTVFQHSRQHNTRQNPPTSAAGQPANIGIQFVAVQNLKSSFIWASAQQQFRLPDVPRVPSRAMSVQREPNWSHFAASAIARHPPQRKGGTKYLAFIPSYPTRIEFTNVED
ncbi:hypothetical protein KIN20_018225 [Parelaphostrongylus tenuis]|uniref:Uncharacterized protein n=1 Tax=Parelaphostrongylus tenuis TaxID=148309 RepID=A0AAD5QRB4_PARTN|nr:hypothetical protein KIN20_018225 [Parelaphostrongylus tenuis]